MEDRRKMTRMLIDVWEDRDFLIGVNAHLKTDNHVKKMIIWLNSHKDAESDEVLKVALDIRHGKV